MCSRPASALARGLSGLCTSAALLPAALVARSLLSWPRCVGFVSICLSHCPSRLLHRLRNRRALPHLQSHSRRPSRDHFFSPRTCPFQPSHSIPASSGPPCLCHISRRPPTGSRLATHRCLGWTSVYCSCCVALLLCSFFLVFAPAPPPITRKETSWPRLIFLLSLTGSDTSSSLLLSLQTALIPFDFRLPFPGAVRGLRFLLYTYFLVCCARAEHLCSNLLQSSLFQLPPGSEHTSVPAFYTSPAYLHEIDPRLL